MRLDFYFDYASPYAYLATLQVPHLGVEVDYRPTAILDVMKAVNNQPSPACPPKARYAGLDVQRWAQLLGYTVKANADYWQALSKGQIDLRTLIRGAMAAQDLGVFQLYHETIFTAVWGEPADVVSEAGRNALLAEAGVDTAALWRLAETPAIHDRLAARTKEAAERGVFGVPTFFLDDEQFFGQDRLEFVKMRIRQGRGGEKAA